MIGQRSRWLVPGVLASLVLLLGVALWGQTLGRGHPSGALAEAGSHLDIDAVPGNGAQPCDPIDTMATVAVGSTYSVAVCLGGYTANDLEAFDLYISNTQALNFAPDPQGAEEPTEGGGGPACGTCLDDNPDANDGDDATGLKLGGGWTCSPFGVVSPRSEVLPIHFTCIADIVSPDLDLAANPGLLATITFDAVSGGTDVLTFASNTVIDMATAQYGSCGDVPDDLIACTGATINIGGAGGLTPSPGTATATPPGPGPSATPVSGPAATPTPLPPGMEAVGLAAGCNPVASTQADNTPIQTIAGGVGPAGNLTSLWEFEAGAWRGYSPQFPDVSDLQETDFLDVVFICTAGPGAFVRPVV